MEMSEQPEGTGLKQLEEPSLRDAVRTIDSLTFRMDVIILCPDKRDTLPEASRQRSNTSREQQKSAAPSPPPPIPPHCPTATGLTPLQVSIPVLIRSIPMPPPAPMPAPPIPASPSPRSPTTIPVPVPPQPVTQSADAKVASPRNPDEVPLGDPSHSPEPKPSPLTSIRSRVGEAALGKYLLSAAVAVLVFLIAVSLVALLWSSIPGIVKVGAVGVTGITLTIAGTGMIPRAATNRLPAVTLTGIGGGLGFVSLAGAALLGPLPLLPAFLTLTGWMIILVLVAARTHLPYITITIALGGLSTIRLAAAQSHVHPEQPFLGLTVVVGYVAVITLTIVMTTRKTVEQSRFRPLYLLPASAIGFPVLFMAPVEKARETAETGTLVATLALVALLFAQFILVVKTGGVSGGEIPETVSEPPPGTPANSWALAWLAAPLLTAISTLRLTPAPPPRVIPDWLQQQDFTLLAVMHLTVLVLMVVPLAFKKVATKAGPWAGHCLFANAFVMVGVLLPQLRNEPLVLGVLVAVLALMVFPAVLAGNVIHVITVPAAVVFLAWSGHDPNIDLVLMRLGILAVVAAVALVIEKRPPDRPEHLVTVWLVVFLLVLRLPSVVEELLWRLGINPAWSITIWGIPTLSVIVALIASRLSSGYTTTLLLFSGKLFGQRAHPVGEPTADTVSLTSSSPVPVTLNLGAAGPLQYVVHAATGWSPVPWLPVTHPTQAFLTHELVLIPSMLAAGCAVVQTMWPMARYPWHGVTTGVTFTPSLFGMNILLMTANVDSATSSAAFITAGALSIVAGFRAYAMAMRPHRLVLVMLMVFKFAVIDMSGQNSITRILSLLVVGAICFALSVAYGQLSAHLNSTPEKPEDSDQPCLGFARLCST